MSKQHTDRLNQLMRCVPQLFDFAEDKKLLYIGLSPARFQFGQELYNCGYEITFVEAHLPNFKYGLEDNRTTIGINCDVRNIDKYTKGKKYDVVFWWHGPEHIAHDELVATLGKLEAITTDLIVLGCPWGIYEQDEVDGNPFEKHQTYFYEHDFSELGYNVDAIGKVDAPNENNLLAWKEMK